MSIGNYAGIIGDFDMTTSCHITSLIFNSMSHMTIIEKGAGPPPGLLARYHIDMMATRSNHIYGLIVVVVFFLCCKTVSNPNNAVH